MVFNKKYCWGIITLLKFAVYNCFVIFDSFEEKLMNNYHKKNRINIIETVDRLSKLIFGYIYDYNGRINTINVIKVYSILFMFMCFMCFGLFFVNGISFITKSDGIDQHYIFLNWYSDRIKEFAKGLLSFKLIFPQWLYYNGEGSDVSTLFNALIGDPFCFFAALFPKNLLKYSYTLSNILRLYFSGLSFIVFCKKKGISNVIGILIGTFVYIFSGFSLRFIGRQPFFLTIFVFIPLIWSGIEDVFNHRNPSFYIISLSVCLMTSLFFSYHISIFIIIYVFILLIVKKMTLKERFIILFQFALYSLVSFLISALSTLPVSYKIINSSTANGLSLEYIFYPLYYYRNLISRFIMPLEYKVLVFGFSSFALLSIITLFMFTKKNELKILLIINFLIVIFPFFAKLFNGMGYVTNRWSYFVTFVVSYIIVMTWEDIIKIKINNVLLLASVIFIVSLFVLHISTDNLENYYIQISICFMLLIMLLSKSRGFVLQVLMMMIVLVSIIVNSYYLYSPNKFNFTRSYLKYSEIDDLVENSDLKTLLEYKNSVNDRDYYRFTNVYPDRIARNIGIMYNISSTRYYNSIYTKSLKDFFDDLNIVRNYRQLWYTYDEKTAILSLSGVKYYKTKNKLFLPFGYKLIKKETGNNEIDLYQNQYALPVLYSYDDAIDISSFSKLNAVEKQQAMCYASIVDDQYSNSNISQYNFTSKNVDYSILNNSKNVYVGSNYCVVYKKNESIVLSFNGLDNSETNILISGFDYRYLQPYDLYFNKKIVINNNLYDIDVKNKYNSDLLSYEEKTKLYNTKKHLIDCTNEIQLSFKANNGKTKNMKYLNEYNDNYNNYHNFDINIGYYKNSLNSISITFPDVGIYKFDDLKIICQPMDYYVPAITKLNDKNIKNINVENDVIAAEIDFDKQKFVCCAIPYEIGWKAYVDGVESKLIRMNIKYFGVKMPTGKHKLEFKYSNPLIKIGGYISLIGVFILVLMNKLYLKKGEQ